MSFIGVHCSIAGGLHKAIEMGEHLKCHSIQIFTQSNRSWDSAPLSKEQIQLFKDAFQQAQHVKRVVAHNSYLLNLSTDETSLRKKSVKYFVGVMERCEALGIESLITHPGSHLGKGVEAGILATCKSLDEILRVCQGFKTQILLENTAGQGGCIGHDFNELKKIVEGSSHPEKIFFCFDTQHAFAAGYDLRTREHYEGTFASFDALLGIKKIKAFHLNDALKDLNSRVDRHENIGKGFLGKPPFEFLVNDPRFSSIPMCLETNPGDALEFYKKDLKILRSLVGKKN